MPFLLIFEFRLPLNLQPKHAPVFKCELRHRGRLLHRPAHDSVFANSDALRSNNPGTFAVFFKLAVNVDLSEADNLTALHHTVLAKLQHRAGSKSDGAVFETTLNFDD